MEGEKEGEVSKEFDDARDFLSHVFASNNHPTKSLVFPTSRPPSKWKELDVLVCHTVWQLCELNFRCKLLRLHQHFSRWPFFPSREIPINPIDLAAHANELSSHLSKVVYSGEYGDKGYLEVDIASARKGLADPDWKKRKAHLLAFQQLMSRWPTEKPPHFFDSNEDENPQQPTEWERALVKYDVQSWFDYSGRPAVLPRTLEEDEIFVAFY